MRPASPVAVAVATNKSSDIPEVRCIFLSTDVFDLILLSIGEYASTTDLTSRLGTSHN